MKAKSRERPPERERQCLFCDRLATSREHLWSAWMRKHFARTAHDETADGYLWISKDDQRETKWRPRHGHTTSTRIRVVCRTCNNGWMSVIDSAAKPFVEPMLLGKKAVLNTAAIRTVARWVALKMMVYEGIDPRECVFTKQDAQIFAESGSSLPAGIGIWLSKTTELEPRAYASRAFANLSRTRGILRKEANIQTTLFVVGRLIVFFVFDRTEGTLNFKEPSQFLAKRLWPPRGPEIVWPPLRTVSESDVAQWAMGLHRFVESRGVLV